MTLLVSTTYYFKGFLKIIKGTVVSVLVVVYCVKAETVHEDLQSGLVKVRPDRLFLEIYSKQSFEAGCCGVPKLKLRYLCLRCEVELENLNTVVSFIFHCYKYPDPSEMVL